MSDGLLKLLAGILGTGLLAAALAEWLRRQREKARALRRVRSHVEIVRAAVEATEKAGDTPRRALELIERLQGVRVEPVAVADVPDEVARAVSAMEAAVTDAIRAAAPVREHMESRSGGIPVNLFNAFEASVKVLRSKADAALAAVVEAESQQGPAAE